MKRLNVLLFACIIMAMVAMTGCSTGAKTDIGLLNNGTLKVAMEIGYPPFEYYSDDGTTPIGLDVDLANAIADELGVKLQTEDTAWDGIFAGLDIDKYDCVISAVTINAVREKDMDFSDSYIENWQAIVVKKGMPAVTSVAGLEGLTVGYQDATASDEYLEEMMQTGVVSCEVAEYDKVINCFDDLRLGRLDAIITDSTVADGYVSREPDNFEITWLQANEEGAEAERFGVAVKQGNDKLREALNGALKTLEENGTLDKIRKSWL